VARPCGAQNIIFIFVKNDERLIIQNCLMALFYNFSGCGIEMRVNWSFTPSFRRQEGLGADLQRLAIFVMLL